MSLFDQILSRILRLFFTLLYGPFAWSYDLVAAVVSLGRWNTWVQTILDDLQGPTLLELGHGPGHLAAAARKKGLPVVGLDRSWQMSRLAFSRQRHLGLNPLLVNGYAQSLPFSSDAFQQVFATFPAEYFWYTDTLSEIARVLHPRGQLLVLPVAWITGSRPMERAARWLFAITGQAPNPQNANWINPLIQRMAQAGFFVKTEYRPLSGSTVMVLRASQRPDVH